MKCRDLAFANANQKMPGHKRRANWGIDECIRRFSRYEVRSDSSHLCEQLEFRNAGRRNFLEWRQFSASLLATRAVFATDADYLILSGGDCIPRLECVATHAASARRGHFRILVVGSRSY